MLFKNTYLLNTSLLLLIMILHYEFKPVSTALSQLKASQMSNQQQQPQLQSSQHVGGQHQQSTTQQQTQQHTAHQAQQQYLPDKDPMQDVLKSINNNNINNNNMNNNNINNNDNELSDPYQILNELKHESTRLPHFPWSSPILGAAPATYPFSPYDRLPVMETPKFLPFIGYPQPVFIPYPFYIAPEMLLPAFSGSYNDIEETMSRAASNRRPSAHHRNSPIFYVRLPPTPYMFVPSFGFTPAAAAPPPPPPPPPPSATHPYSSMYPLSPFSSIFNLPINFLANGKPSNIYQMSSPNDIQNPLHFNAFNNFATRPASPPPPPPPPPPQLLPPPGNYLPQNSFGGIPSAPSQPSTHQDSKMLSLKRPFLFNGRPDDIYILPNNFNHLYSETNYF